jgi:hypothetical protein
MGFDLNAFLGRFTELRTWKGRLPSAVVCQLGGELGLVPVTGKLLQELRAWLAKEEANRPGAAQAGRTYSPPDDEEVARRWGAEASVGTAAVYVSAGEFGDQSYEEATLWADGREILSRARVSAALSQLRGQTGLDLGNEPLDLGWHRGEDAAEKWAAAATAQRPAGG